MSTAKEHFLAAVAALQVLDERPDRPVPVYLAPDRFVTVALYSILSGRSENAIRMKIKEGKWIAGREFVRDPDGTVMIDRQGVQAWVMHGR